MSRGDREKFMTADDFLKKPIIWEDIDEETRPISLNDIINEWEEWQGSKWQGFGKEIKAAIVRLWDNN